MPFANISPNEFILIKERDKFDHWAGPLSAFNRAVYYKVTVLTILSRDWGRGAQWLQMTIVLEGRNLKSSTYGHSSLPPGRGGGGGGRYSDIFIHT